MDITDFVKELNSVITSNQDSKPSPAVENTVIQPVSSSSATPEKTIKDSNCFNSY
jgi:hypothetical protein